MQTLGLGLGIGFGRKKVNSAYDPKTDANLNLYYSSRSGNTLTETGSGSSRNAQIMPRVAKFAGTEWLNFGATYNPSPAYLTIYAAFKKTATSGNGGIFASGITGSPYTQLSLYVDQSTGKVGTYTNAYKYSTGTPATTNTWVKVMIRWKLGNAGKVEILYNGGNWETLHDNYNFQTSLITGNGVMSVGAWQGTTGNGNNFFTGSIADVKIWESSKEWADRDSACDMHIPLAGNSVFEFAMNSTTKIAAQWAAPQYRFEYTEYGSKYWMDNGWELWKKNVYATPVTQWTPKGCVQTALLAGSWVQVKVYDGSATGFNFFDAYIDFDPTSSAHTDLDCWNRDNTTIFNDYARVNYTLAGYIHQYYTSKPYYWHSDEINRNSLKNYTKTGHTNRLFPKATDNSMGFNSRKLLVEILSMDEADSTKTAKVETYTGDLLSNTGICISFDDFSRDANRLTSMTDADAKWWQRFFPKWTWFMDVDSEGDLTTNEAALQAIIDKGHELANHTKDHPEWVSYVAENGAQAFYDNQILPVQGYFTNVFGSKPLGFGYPSSMGYNATVNSLCLASEFEYVRYALSYVASEINDCQYSIGSGSNMYPAWYYFEDSIADLKAAIDYAKANNKVFVIVFHQLAAAVSGSSASYEIFEQMLTHILDNNMSWYMNKELPNL